MTLAGRVAPVACWVFGLVSLAGLPVTGYAAIEGIGRKGGEMPVGTLAGTAMVALYALGALAFLFSIGSGPAVL